MKKLFLSMIVLLSLFSTNTTQAFINATVNMSTEDRELIEKTMGELKEMIKDLKSIINELPKGATQGGIVLTSTATSILSAYAVFLIIRYELSRQPDAQEPRKNISWKTVLAGSIGTIVFTGSLVALIKSSAIADYAIAA